MTESTDKWSTSVQAALAVGQKLATTTEEFNQACDHIVQLLRDASTLLANNSHATAAFLAITALEETSKVHIGSYRSSGQAVPRRKDPLYRHDEKHLIAVGPTVAMGNRLQEAIGVARMNELIELARSGGLVQLREASLYVEQQGTALKAPKDAITKSTSRELLLLAIEAFDDGLVGYTTHTFVLSEQTDALFAQWKLG